MRYHRYKTTKYNNSEEQMKKYTTLMSAYGIGVGIDFKFHGMVANTLSAHRLIQHFQEEMGPEVADKIVNSLYRQYFEEEAHPAAPATLLKAAVDGGVELSEAEAFVGDEYEALPETRLLIREQASNGIEYVISPLDFFLQHMSGLYSQRSFLMFDAFPRTGNANS